MHRRTVGSSNLEITKQSSCMLAVYQNMPLPPSRAQQQPYLQNHRSHSVAKRPCYNSSMHQQATPSSEEQTENLRIWAMPPLKNHFPVTFANNAVFTALQLRCHACAQTLPDECVHGEVASFSKDIYLVHAIGICLECRAATKCDYRLYSNMSIAGRGQDGQWRRWDLSNKPKKNTLAMAIQSIGSAIRWLFTPPKS
jgi:hypothetical protein